MGSSLLDVPGRNRGYINGRRTVRRYLREAEELRWIAGEHEVDEALVLEVSRRVRPAPGDDGPGPAEAKLLPHLAQIRARPCPCGVTAVDAGPDGRTAKVFSLWFRAGDR